MRFKRGTALLLALCAALPIGILAQSHTAYAASAPRALLARACNPAASALSEPQLRSTNAGNAFDGICFLVGICTAVWPIGTLICGPTAIGCTIHYWQQ